MAPEINLGGQLVAFELCKLDWNFYLAVGCFGHRLFGYLYVWGTVEIHVGIKWTWSKETKSSVPLPQHQRFILYRPVFFQYTLPQSSPRWGSFAASSLQQCVVGQPCSSSSLCPVEQVVCHWCFWCAFSLGSQRSFAATGDAAHSVAEEELISVLSASLCTATTTLGAWRWGWMGWRAGTETSSCTPALRESTSPFPGDRSCARFVIQWYKRCSCWVLKDANHRHTEWRGCISHSWRHLADPSLCDYFHHHGGTREILSSSLRRK